MVFLGFIAGPVFDNGHLILLLRIGSILILVGMIMQGLSSEYWHLFLSQGICMGIGMGLLAVPSVAIPSAWFTTAISFGKYEVSNKLPLANGIVVSASGFGGVIYPIMIRSLIPKIGFKFTSLSVALVTLLTLGVSNIVLRQPTPPKAKRAFFDKSALKDTPYILFVVGCMLSYLGIYTTFFYLSSYAVQEKITTENTASYFVSSGCHSYFFTDPVSIDPQYQGICYIRSRSRSLTHTLLVLNGASVFGRVIPNIPSLTLRLGPLNMMVTSVVSMAIIVLTFNTRPDLAGLVVSIVLYGFFTGAFFTLQPTIFAQLTDDPSRLGTRTGMASTM
ncbi:major facilitator superfamily transporter [Diaporthe helianthi]|uniref:Major facilitator superfamily transporter n=1 Tax=Diaporthe helianthi TaxID=158607 RepID=A0A2P5HFA8_DIAHE|nr:major facilitator superfamily transporter [Diaporthe helianthi]